MLRTCLVLSLFLWQGIHAGSDSHKVLSGHRSSQAFQNVFQEYHQKDQQKKSSWNRAWSKTRNMLMGSSVSLEYDVFTWWWVRQCLQNPSLDPTGIITRDLLTKATGFDGWYTSNNYQGVHVDELKLYKSAAFLFYWSFYDAPKPNQGPILLKNLWVAAQQKQCLRIEPNFVLLSDGKAWLENVTPTNWSPEEKPLDDAINEKFDVKDPSQFENEWGERWLSYYGPVDALRKWLGDRTYVTLSRMFFLASDAFIQENFSVDKKRAWIKNILVLSRVMSVNTMLNMIRQKDMSYLGCLYMVLTHHELIEDEDIENFREFLRTFDPEHVDVEQNKIYLRWLNIALRSAFQLKWAEKNGDKEKKLDHSGADSPVSVFKAMYNEEAERGLWPSFQNDSFPYVMLFLAFTTHSDVDAHKAVYQSALMRTLKQTSDVETAQGLQSFLWNYLNNIMNALESRTVQYIVTRAGKIGERDVAVGEVVTKEVEHLAPSNEEGQAQWEKQEVCEHPYNIWDGDNKELIQQRISMALDYLVSQDGWPADLPYGLINRSHKLAMMLLVYQRSFQEIDGKHSAEIVAHS